MIYYKGVITELSKLDAYVRIGYNLGNIRYGDYSDSFRKRIGGDDVTNIRTKLHELRSFYDDYKYVEIEDNYLINVFRHCKYFINFNDIFEYMDFDELDGNEIIYSKIVDEKGRVFAKELKTGYIFPLLHESTFSTKYYLTSRDEHKDDYDVDRYTLNMTVEVSDPIIAKAETVIVEDEIANLNDVEAYLNSFERDSDSYYDYDLDEDDLEEEAKKNVFSKEIVEKEVKNVSMSDENKLLGQIRYYLTCLRNISQSDYDKYSNDYEHLIETFGETDVNTPVTKNDLERLLSTVKFLCLFNREHKDGISSSLIKINNDSASRIISGEARIKEFSINKLDSLFELFLENKNLCSLDEQDELLTNFASSYILKLQEFNLDENDLASTHFSDLSYYILSITGIEEDTSFEEYTLEEIVSRIRKLTNNGKSIVKHI